jgi:hypothetical protein
MILGKRVFEDPYSARTSRLAIFDHKQNGTISYQNMLIQFSTDFALRQDVMNYIPGKRRLQAIEIPYLCWFTGGHATWLISDDYKPFSAMILLLNGVSPYWPRSAWVLMVRNRSPKGRICLERYLCGISSVLFAMIHLYITQS